MCIRDSQITVPVSVQQQGRPELNCLLAAQGALVFPWVAPPGDLAAVRVWLSEDGGPWEDVYKRQAEGCQAKQPARDFHRQGNWASGLTEPVLQRYHQHHHGITHGRCV